MPQATFWAWECLHKPERDQFLRHRKREIVKLDGNAADTISSAWESQKPHGWFFLVLFLVRLSCKAQCRRSVVPPPPPSALTNTPFPPVHDVWCQSLSPMTFAIFVIFFPAEFCKFSTCRSFCFPLYFLIHFIGFVFFWPLLWIQVVPRFWICQIRWAARQGGGGTAALRPPLLAAVAWLLLLLLAGAYGAFSGVTSEVPPCHKRLQKAILHSRV